jgi:hypothetical protein
MAGGATLRIEQRRACRFVPWKGADSRIASSPKTRARGSGEGSARGSAFASRGFMGAIFVPCPSCARHVRNGDGACPFCGAEVPDAPLAAPTARMRLSRAAIVAAGAAAALGALDCGGKDEGLAATTSASTTSSTSSSTTATTTRPIQITTTFSSAYGAAVFVSFDGGELEDAHAHVDGGVTDASVGDGSTEDGSADGGSESDADAEADVVDGNVIDGD